VKWTLSPAASFPPSLCSAQKIATAEAANLFSHLFTVYRLLLGGASIDSVAKTMAPLLAKDGDICSIDLAGAHAEQSETFLLGRLYFYADEGTKTLHPLLIGRKETTHDDLLMTAAGHIQSLREIYTAVIS
jgi:hypothetical protein